MDMDILYCQSGGRYVDSRPSKTKQAFEANAIKGESQLIVNLKIPVDQSKEIYLKIRARILNTDPTSQPRIIGPL